MAMILVVDDDHELLDSEVRLLTRGGHQVASATNGRKALEFLEGVSVDVVVTDIEMPEMDGIEFINALRAQQPDLPVVAVSGAVATPKELLLEDAGMMGALATLTKPFTPDQLFGAVDHALARAARMTDAEGDGEG